MQARYTAIQSLTATLLNALFGALFFSTIIYPEALESISPETDKSLLYLARSFLLVLLAATALLTEPERCRSMPRPSQSNPILYTAWIIFFLSAAVQLTWLIWGESKTIQEISHFTAIIAFLFITLHTARIRFTNRRKDCIEATKLP